jgi:hypothetical protein
MAHTLSETHGNANFGTGLTVPDNGDSGSTWWGVLIAAYQQIVDRLQRLRLWVPDAPTVRVVLSDALQVGTRFVFASETSGLTWRQDDVASVGELQFELRNLPVGRKITGVTAYWLNKNNAVLPVTSMPTVELLKHSVATGDAWTSAKTSVGSQADTTAVVATYRLMHAISLTGLSETIAEDTEYYVKFSGETGTNATTGGNLTGIRVTLGI